MDPVVVGILHQPIEDHEHDEDDGTGGRKGKQNDIPAEAFNRCLHAVPPVGILRHAQP